MSNKDLREAMRSSGVHQWQVAERAGVSEFTFSRKMRKELPGDEKEKILHIIREIGGGGNSEQKISARR